MNYTLTILEEQYQQLSEAIFACPGLEGAAYLLCGLADTDGEKRFLVNKVIPVEPHHYLVREPLRLSISSDSYASAAKRARRLSQSIIFVHSHPGGFLEFSAQDDREEPKLHRFFHDRVAGVPHGSLIVTGPNGLLGRVWTVDGWLPMSRIRVLGQRFRFIDSNKDGGEIPEFFDRQVRAFGPDIQRMLNQLNIGVVGLGGTGSAVAEQLARLGVGTLSLFDGEEFESSNVNRVYGSSTRDVGRLKVDIAADSIARIGLNTKVCPFPVHITDLNTARRLRECDLVFGCTDRHAPRGILVQLSLRYLIPVFDMGVKIDSHDGTIRGIPGRVTTLLPGEACLFCRGRTSARAIALESCSLEERQALADEQYAPELEGPAPAVIACTTAVAAQAVLELLHRMTGFMGENRRSSEVLLLLHEARVRTNRLTPSGDCFCSEKENWGRGDTKRFLDLAWSDTAAKVS